jgi:hypothetical protein
MPSRTKNQVIDTQSDIIPDAYHGDLSLIYGQGGGLHTVEVVVDALYGQGLWGQSTSPWVDLHALGRGVSRAQGESDASLGARISRYDRKVTPAAMIDAADAILGAAGLGGWVVVLEHWRDGAFADSSGYVDQGGEYGGGRILDFADAITNVVSDIYADYLDTRYEAWVFGAEEIRPHGARVYTVVSDI